jgi:peptidoglycan/LPS O-acetylase OafA/YrhL
VAGTGTDPVRGHAFPHLDGLRALAAFAVVATHAGFQTGRALDSGPFAPFLARMDFGVTVFFLLSGFLLYRPFVAAALAGRPAPAVGRFYLRRAVRILPAYWLAVVVTLVTVAAVRLDLGGWLAYLTLTHPYVGTPVDPALSQMWTLTVELSFYAVLPLLAAASLRRGGDLAGQLRRQSVLLGGLVAAQVAYVLVVKGAAVTEGDRGLLWLPAHLDWFALGMGFAVVSCALGHPQLPVRSRLRRLDDMAADPATCWVLGGLLFWFATLPVAGPRTLSAFTTWEWFTRHAVYGLAAACLLLPAVFGDPHRGVIRAALASRPARSLGEVSYGVYLWHLMLLTWLVGVLGLEIFRGGFAVLFPLTAVTATVVAAASYRLVERPLLARVRSPRRSSRSGPATPASATAQPT